MLVLLDTNAYLRLAKRIKPMLGVRFGHNQYRLTVLKDVEIEVQKSRRLRFHYPWFDDSGLVEERIAKRVRMSPEEKTKLENVAEFLHDYTQIHAARFTTNKRSPPSRTDCRMLAFGQVREAVVVTDDLGMHQLAEEFEISVWHGYELLHKMRAAQVIDSQKIREIYQALEANGDLPQAWEGARETLLRKVFR